MTPHFHPLTIAELPQILACAHRASGRLCDRTAGILYMWAKQLDTCFAETDRMLLLRSRWNGHTVYAFPSGEGDLAAALDTCRADAQANGTALSFASLTEAEADLISSTMGLPFLRETDDGWKDYLYEADALAALAGRAYHRPRTHINRFLAEYPAYRYDPLTPDQLGEVTRFYAEHRRRTADPAVPSAMAEAEAAADLLDLYPALLEGGAPLLGGVLRVGGEIVGFSVGELLGDTLFVHVEKGNTAYSGVYPMLVREFSRLGIHHKVRYINREEDDGHPGLRRSKQTYRPTALLGKVLLRCP